MNNERLTGAEQRARRQQAEAELYRQRQANAQQRARSQQVSPDDRVKPQRPASRDAVPRQFSASRAQNPMDKPPEQFHPGAQRPPAPRRNAPGGSGDGRQPPKKRHRSENRWFRALLMVAATVVGCVFLSMFVLQSANDLFGLNQPDEDIPVTIPQGYGISDISRLLREVGVVEQPLTFRVYLSFKGCTDEEMQPGDYVFNSEMAYDEIIIALRSGRTTKEEKRLTFIEGMTMLEIARQLEEDGICDADEFISYLDTEEFSYEFYGAMDDNPLRYHKLEGYIFPDTYDFYVGENVDSVAKKFLRNINEKFTSDLLARMQNLNMTIDETLTLASIIQKEAGDSDDMRLVSSVFHNRMESGGQFPNLQSDVTILYVESDIKPRETLANQAMYDAYNTYVCEGLPVGPICNPGLDAIEAALYPESTEFYFFVTDANMDFYYATTAQQHYGNVAEAASIGEYHGIDTR